MTGPHNTLFSAVRNEAPFLLDADEFPNGPAAQDRPACNSLQRTRAIPAGLRVKQC